MEGSVASFNIFSIYDDVSYYRTTSTNIDDYERHHVHFTACLSVIGAHLQLVVPHTRLNSLDPN